MTTIIFGILEEGLVYAIMALGRKEGIGKDSFLTKDRKVCFSGDP